VRDFRVHSVSESAFARELDSNRCLTTARRAWKIALKVERRSRRLLFRFGLFASECLKKYLARAGASEIIEP
jgi:hypothetical protein